MFEDILAQLRNPGEGVDYATIADTLESQATTLAQGWQATVEQKDSAIATLAKESSELKSHNYTLMMKQNTSDKSLTENIKSNDDSVIHGVQDLFM